MPVLVLNASYEPISVCTIRRAVVLLLKEKAEIIEKKDGLLRAETFSIEYPDVIRLVTYVRLPYVSYRRVTRRAILARDSWQCQYCGSGNGLTIDHVVPRSKGGLTSWENVVSACSPCNKRKRDLLPREAGLRLSHEPRPPDRTVFVLVATRTPPVAWSRWL